MHLVILGNGISGITTARHVRKRDSDCRITVISDESDYFFSRTALMYVYMGHLRFQDTKPYEDWFWAKNRIELKRARVERIDFQNKKLFIAQGESIAYDKLVLALGSRSNKLDWPGQDLDGVQGLYSLQDLESMERHSQRLLPTNYPSPITNHRAVIVGGGLIGVEMAEMLHARRIPVTFLVREPEFWSNVLPLEEARMVSRHLREHGIDVRLGTELKEILPGPYWSDDLRSSDQSPSSDGSRPSDEYRQAAKHVGAVITNTGEKIPCGFVGLTVGVSPNVGFLKNSGLKLHKGILVDAYLETSQPGVFAIGDCAELRQPQPGRRAIEPVWYTGRLMGETLAHTLTGEKRAYDPGPWFNSAKFFDIEYQTYGDIPAELPEHQAALYWEHPGGKKSIRIHYDKRSQAVLGFNLMGVRYRHEVCERWLRRQTPVEEVLTNLGLANFDPEFQPQYEAELIARYNRQTGAGLKLGQKRGLPAVLDFLKKSA